MSTMPTTTPTSAPITRSEPALRIVLFGMPDAGKSSLLGALAQSAITQERILQGRLLDIPPTMEELRQRVYGDRTRETLDEIVPHPVTFEPFQGTQTQPTRWPVVLYDCDGRVANELLTRRKSFDRDAKTGSLAQAVLDADALILVIDASAVPEQIEADFREFSRFLKFLREHRTKDRQVGGLPVFLALSKCDKLAHDGDSAESWVYRINDRKEQVFERFGDFLRAIDRDAANGEWLPFGSIGLDLQCTAIQPPMLRDQPQPEAARPEPYGVAELFHTCLNAAREYRGRMARSDRRLIWTLAGSLVVLVGMFIFGLIALLSEREQVQSPLLAKVQNYQGREGQTASLRLAENGLVRRISELTELRKDPEFDKLPADTKQFVERRLAEFEEYRKFNDALTFMRAPSEAFTIKDLDRIEQTLNGLQVPEAYRKDWEQTEAVQLREKWVKDVPLLRDAVGKVNDSFGDLIRMGNGLLFANRLDNQWLRDVNSLMKQEATPRFRETDRIPDSQSLPLKRGGPMTYASAYNFDLVEKSRSDWERVREKLSLLAEMATALGIVGEANSGRAVLVFTPSTPTTNIPELSAARLNALKKLYPRYKDWSIESLPDPVRPLIRDRMQLAYKELILDGQHLIQRKFASIVGNRTESHTDWLKIADWLSSPNDPQVSDYRELLKFVEQQIRPREIDAITRLTTFLRRDSFDLAFDVIRVNIPPDLRDQPVKPLDNLTILYQSLNGQVNRSIIFKLDDNGQRDGQGFYRFKITDSSNAKLTFYPGDTLWGSALLKSGARELKFTWSSYHSRSYQFESIVREPLLSDANETGKIGERASKVIMEVIPANGVPSVPELLPDVLKN